MTATEGHSVPDLPLPIFQISQKAVRYLLYDIDTVTWLRRNHNILGVFIGSLPQSPQQNVFLGLPLELQPEEATLLVEKDLAFITDDLQNHKSALLSPPAGLNDYKANLRREGFATAKAIVKQKQQRTEDALQRLSLRRAEPDTADKADGKDDNDESLFSAPQQQAPEPTPLTLVPYTSTPTTSYPPVPAPTKQSSLPMPEVSASSYALFKHLHSLGYFMSPGLRFGCQFSVYPGDPLRFHSHFLATSAEWDEEMDLLDLIGGGRLGTGVKKGWLIGGAVKNGNGHGKDDAPSTDVQSGEIGKSESSHVRTFCVEWAGM
ncbi:MAG: hypothetical protein L6R40_007329 [Gallowayella cf. fulva]|nr:MAG: hypothetical protein L6R40_007329 [Xanthomendoza cf. fulva]